MNSISDKKKNNGALLLEALLLGNICSLGLPHSPA